MRISVVLIGLALIDGANPLTRGLRLRLRSW